MKYIFINAEKRRISVEEFMPEIAHDRLSQMQALCARGGNIEAVSRQLPNNDTVFVDEEGLYKDYTFGFFFCGQLLKGNGIVCGFNPDDGETVEVKSTELQIALNVEFASIKDLREMEESL